jgi:hypothetical protein
MAVWNQTECRGGETHVYWTGNLHSIQIVPGHVEAAGREAATVAGDHCLPLPYTPVS